jgi:hypothetical protein
MLTNEQKSLLKRAQRQAVLADVEYREALTVIAGVNTSTHPRVGNEHLDKIMKYFEAIYWRKIDGGELIHQPGKWEPFLRRGYWAEKNTPARTSRDGFTEANLAVEISRLETAMAELGYNGFYCNSIRLKVAGGRSDSGSLHRYKFALKRTLESKQKKFSVQPF